MPALQVDACGAHVADHLLRRFLEQEVEALRPAQAASTKSAASVACWCRPSDIIRAGA
jgi:hypothetical protein